MEEIEVLTQFECAMIGSAELENRFLKISVPFDPVCKTDWLEHDYRLHFCFGLKNKTESQITVSVSVNSGHEVKLKKKMPPLYGAETPEGPYTRFDADSGKTDLFNRYLFDIDLLPGETKFISNTIPRTLGPLHQKFTDIAAKGYARKTSFGKSLDGRDLEAYEYRREGNDRPVVMVTSGMHPPEPDTFATEAIMEFLGSDLSWPLREVFDFIIVPIVNPDGYARATQACNAAGVNIYWDFRFKDVGNCPEAYFLYKLASDVRPSVYIDFHAYTFQTQKIGGPYCKPLRRYSGSRVRTLVREINTGFSQQMPDQKAMQGYVTYTPSSLGEILTRAFNTISYAKYHIHLQDGELRCKEVAVNVLELISKVLKDADIRLKGDLIGVSQSRSIERLCHDAMCWGDTLWNGLLHRRLYEFYVTWIKPLTVTRCRTEQ